MNLQQLEYIIALDKTKNFSSAAELCHITQATLSTMVKRLEDELDVVIFDRKTNPILTTECGKEIIELAKASIRSANQIKELSKEVKGKAEGAIKVGIIPTISSSVSHALMSTFLTNFPNIKLEIKEITTDYIINQLKEGFIDVGIISTPLPKKVDLEEEVLFYEALYVYGNTTHGKMEYVFPEEISKEKIWLLEEGHCLRSQFVNLCSLNKRKMQDNLKFEANSFETLLNMVDSLGGLTVLPELYLKQLSKERQQKITPFHSPHPVREISMVFHRPYAKFRLQNLLAAEMKRLFTPNLLSSQLKKSEQVIVMN